MGSDPRPDRHQRRSPISIHAPAWGATRVRDRGDGLGRDISIHAPAWGATSRISEWQVTAIFQSTLPHGERPRSSTAQSAKFVFQSTLPHGERRRVRSWTRSSDTYFNPRSRMGSDVITRVYPYGKGIQISIHAPAWGATEVRGSFLVSFLISIHAPAWGATAMVFLISGVLSDFNPRSRMGSDRPATTVWDARRDFNPRSRMGSDSDCWWSRLCGRNFNPRSRMGSDRSFTVAANNRRKFQSTLPHGERRKALAMFVARWRFQSTLPHGERPRLRTRSHRSRRHFNPRSRMGSDAESAGSDHASDAFQSTLPHGERPDSANPRPKTSRFQSTLPHGERQTEPSSPIITSYFNPRSRMGSDLEQWLTSGQ